MSTKVSISSVFVVPVSSHTCGNNNLCGGSAVTVVIACEHVECVGLSTVQATEVAGKGRGGTGTGGATRAGEDTSVGQRTRHLSP